VRSQTTWMVHGLMIRVDVSWFALVGQDNDALDQAVSTCALMLVCLGW
jgi:hypothetical protein